MEQYGTSTYHSNSRTAGHYDGQIKSVQAWKTKKTSNVAPQTASPQLQQAQKPDASVPTNAASQQIMANLDKAAKGQVGVFDTELDNALAYANASTPIDTQNTSTTSQNDGFGFDDVVDVVNPLHHLPVVGMVYRGLTGDKLHPMSQIIGGAIYGGPIGAVTGTINAVAQVQTGKDVSDHALNMIGFGPKVPAQALPADKNDPIAQLEYVSARTSNNQALEELPGNTLSFVNLAEQNLTKSSTEKIEPAYAPIAEGRTAGTMAIKKSKNFNTNYNTGFSPAAPTSKQSIDVREIPEPVIEIEKLAPRETITSMYLSPMPKRESN